MSRFVHKIELAFQKTQVLLSFIKICGFLFKFKSFSSLELSVFGTKLGVDVVISDSCTRRNPTQRKR